MMLKTGFIALFTIVAGVARAQNATLPTTGQMLVTLNKLLSDFTYPNLLSIAKQTTYDGFSDDVVGRLDVTATYAGNELATEYIFGFAAFVSQLNTTLILGYPVNQTLTALTVDPPVVAASVIINYDWRGKIGIQPVPLNMMYVFNSQGQITQWDYSMPRLPMLMASIQEQIADAIAQELHIKRTKSNTVALLQRRAAIDICTNHDLYCTGSNQQYASYAECMNTILNKKPFGEWYAAGVDNAVCRWIHTGMLQYRPQVHCPHVGPTGGDMCQPTTYAQAVLSNPFSVPFVGAAELQI